MGSAILGLFFLNFKFMFIFPTLLAIEKFIFYNLLAFVLLKLFLGSFLLYGILIDDLKKYKSYYI